MATPPRRDRGGAPAGRASRSTAASDRRARWSPRERGPSRSSSAPKTDAGGRWSGAALRRPRSSTIARVRDRVCRSSQESVAADVRPATRISARRDAAAVRKPANATRRGSRLTGGAALSWSLVSTTSSGLSRSIASRQRRARSATAYPATSSSHRGRALSVGKSGICGTTSSAREIATTSAE